MSQGRVAGAQDDVLAEVGVQLFLEGGLHVNLGQNAEAFFFQCSGHPLDGLLVGQVQPGSKSVISDCLGHFVFLLAVYMIYVSDQFLTHPLIGTDEHATESA